MKYMDIKKPVDDTEVQYFEKRRDSLVYVMIGLILVIAIFGVK